jgi:hypothetical protein
LGFTAQTGRKHVDVCGVVHSTTLGIITVGNSELTISEAKPSAQCVISPDIRDSELSSQEERTYSWQLLVLQCDGLMARVQKNLAFFRFQLGSLLASQEKKQITPT